MLQMVVSMLSTMYNTHYSQSHKYALKKITYCNFINAMPYVLRKLQVQCLKYLTSGI